MGKKRFVMFLVVPGIKWFIDNCDVLKFAANDIKKCSFAGANITFNYVHGFLSMVRLLLLKNVLEKNENQHAFIIA